MVGTLVREEATTPDEAYDELAAHLRECAECPVMPEGCTEYRRLWERWDALMAVDRLEDQITRLRAQVAALRRFLQR